MRKKEYYLDMSLGSGKLSFHSLANTIRHLPETGDLGISLVQKRELITLLREKYPRNYVFQGAPKNQDASLVAMNKYYECNWMEKQNQRWYEIGYYMGVAREIKEGMRGVYKKEYIPLEKRKKYNTDYDGYRHLYGFYNRIGKLAVPIKYASVYNYSQGFAAVLDEKTKKRGFINKKGENLTKFQWEKVSSFACGKAMVYNAEAKKYAYINLDGELDSMRYEFDRANSYENGYALVKINDQGVYKRDLLGNLEEISADEYSKQDKMYREGK